mmetsp:Transcript_69190/g.150555  ORF Transcript_69190/g.150555 Transcript_69190/m.150555 type:complete len:229 (+) Transcript_69190:163-849(+)
MERRLTVLCLLMSLRLLGRGVLGTVPGAKPLLEGRDALDRVSAAKPLLCGREVLGIDSTPKPLSWNSSAKRRRMLSLSVSQILSNRRSLRGLSNSWSQPSITAGAKRCVRKTGFRYRTAASWGTMLAEASFCIAEQNLRMLTSPVLSVSTASYIAVSSPSDMVGMISSTTFFISPRFSSPSLSTSVLFRISSGEIPFSSKAADRRWKIDLLQSGDLLKGSCFACANCL